MDYQNQHQYDDILNLPHPTSKNHPRMSLHDRAAQFSPFAALTGHEAAIKETARLTDDKQILSTLVMTDNTVIPIEQISRICGLQDCEIDLWDMYADYINGKREIAEINMDFKPEYKTI